MGWTGRKGGLVCALVFTTLTYMTTYAQERIEMNCDPRISHRYDKCPAGYCCVRDEFLPTYVYCKKFGQEDNNCVTRKNDESDCPCADGLYCKANIMGEFPSLYGRCYNSSRDPTTTTTTATTTPTTPEVSNTTMPIVVTTTENSTMADNSTSGMGDISSMSSVNATSPAPTTASGKDVPADPVIG